MSDAYQEFLRRKVAIAPDHGLTISLDEVNPRLFDWQRRIVCWAIAGGRRALFLKFGLGKCHGAGTPILMANGDIKPVEDIQVGDKLMGDDGTPRNVLTLARGREEIFRVTLKNGDSYTCNGSHILSLRVSNPFRGNPMGTVIDMPLAEFLSLTPVTRRNCLKHYKAAIDFPTAEVPFDPYLYGAWLGDGSSRHMSWTINDLDTEIVDRIRAFASSHGFSVRVQPESGCTTYHVNNGPIFNQRYPELEFLRSSAINGKRIDRRYLLNSRELRLQLLAGLIDTDGHLIDKCYEIATKWESLRDDILFLVRSLGFAASYGEKLVNGVQYWRVYVSGHTDLIPCITRKKAQKRRQIKNPLVYGFEVESLGIGDYYGFEIDGNHRYLLGDFTVTHNTVQQLEIERLILSRTGGRGLIVTYLGVRQEFQRDAVNVLGWADPPRFIRSIDEADDTGIYLTNYETIRDGKLDPRHFNVVSLDEGDILRGFGGTKTFRECMRLFAGDGKALNSRERSAGIPYRFVATATPSPNELLELAAYAAFLGVMEVADIKSRFFKRDSTKADHLTLQPGREREFWMWCSSWALFLERPSDMGPEYSDAGYELPPLEVRWHEVASDHSGAGVERDGQRRMFRDAGIGVVDAAREKRDTLSARIAKMLEIRAIAPDAHRIIWHDLEAEREAIEEAVPSVASVYGSQDLEVREQIVSDFKDGLISELASKPSLLGSGTNLQRHCHQAIYLGIGWKFRDFIQSLHRLQRYLQQHPVQIDLIYTEAERGIRMDLERKWSQHQETVETMTGIIKEYGLSHQAMAQALTRSLGIERVEVSGDSYKLVNNDCVLETRTMTEASVDLVLTSVPFSNQYSYSPRYEDFGHSDTNAHFFEQMDFLTPELLRVLKPGRVAAIHVKDRIVPGGMTGLGFQTVYPFHARCIEHYTRHGFAYMGMKTVVTDVVRENNQTYRLGWTEQCKDGTKMGCGMPEYLLLFRKPPTDTSNSYSDEPVVKSKDSYSRSRWQIDAHGFARSSGNRLLQPQELEGLPHDVIFKLFRDYGLTQVYDFEHHARLGEALDARGMLPVTFMLLQPPSWHPDVWADITRMLTLNGAQSAKGREMHLCPLPIDLADRVIEQFSMPGETVLDPFNGIGTTVYRAILKKRRGVGIELNTRYFLDSASYCKAAEQEVSMPDLLWATTGSEAAA